MCVHLKQQPVTVPRRDSSGALFNVPAWKTVEGGVAPSMADSWALAAL